MTGRRSRLSPVSGGSNCPTTKIPPLVVHAFISAEDKDFFEHHGIDFPGLIGAVVDYAIKSVTGGGRAKGGSTITQQVAKYLLKDSSYNVGRKAREAILAFRLKSTLTKQQILELYLNSIFLGRNAYGVQAAARAYFDKDVNELTLPEAAYLAVLPKAPANYDPVRATQKALDRRNYVLREMSRNGYITEDQWKTAAATPLGTIRYGSSEKFRQQGGYFMEEVRRELIKTVRRGCEEWPQQPLRRRPVGAQLDGPGDAGCRGAGASRRPGPVRRRPRLADTWQSVDLDGDWAGRARPGAGRHRLSRLAKGGRAGEGRRRRRRSDSPTARRARCPASDAAMPKRGVGGRAFDSLRPGMVIIVKQVRRSNYALRSVPEVSGGMLAEEVHTGRVLAMQGGFDVVGSSYNRRDPGASAARLGVQADRLCDCAPERLHAGDHRARCAVLRLAGRRPRQQSASSTSTAARPGRTRCAGASSSRAT